jgi:hypothetical protein
MKTLFKKFLVNELFFATCLMESTKGAVKYVV